MHQLARRRVQSTRSAPDNSREMMRLHLVNAYIAAGHWRAVKNGDI
jgi:hypothetical protein